MEKFYLEMKSQAQDSFKQSAFSLSQISNNFHKSNQTIAVQTSDNQQTATNSEDKSV
jgi:hypothetical protein